MPINSKNSDESFNESIKALEARLEGVENQEFDAQISSLESVIDDLGALLEPNAVGSTN
ncbi:MAG: hypothetical protein LBC50_00415 [Candidatus Ancillula sp.]|nr:hypothetical protein [Candidatus Ancillula sp.]